MSSDHPPPVGPPYYNRLPSVFTPLVFRNRGYCVKQDLADWLEVNKKEHIKGSPYKDTVNVYIVYYLQVTLFADPRLPSTAFLRAFGAEVMPTEDPPTTPRFDRLCNKSAALSALNAHSPSVVTRRKAAAASSTEVVHMFIDSTYKGSWFVQSDCTSGKYQPAVPTEDPPTTPRFDRMRNKSAALSALNAHSPSVVTRRKAAAAISIEVVVRMFIDSTYKGSWFAQSDLHFWKVPTSSAN